MLAGSGVRLVILSLVGWAHSKASPTIEGSGVAGQQELYLREKKENLKLNRDVKVAKVDLQGLAGGGK